MSSDFGSDSPLVLLQQLECSEERSVGYPSMALSKWRHQPNHRRFVARAWQNLVALTLSPDFAGASPSMIANENVTP